MSAGRPESQPGGVRAGGHAGSSPLAAAYGLVFTVLGCVGVSAGQILFVGDRAVSAPATGVIDRCALRFPLSASALGDLTDLARCTAPAYRYQGLFVLGAAAVTVAVAAALTMIVPRNDRRRLHPAGEELPAPLQARAGVRFASLCDAAGLAGRRQPRLVIPGLQTHEPSTIAVPGRRPLIVVPAAVAMAESPERFEAAVFHEMAHVKHGDASWVSSVRWIAVVTIPAVILACLPELLDGGGTQVPAAVLTRAAVFAVLAVVIARWLLRRREIEADRQAARWLGSPLPLIHLLETGLKYPRRNEYPRRSGWRPSRLLALHPLVPARIAALQDLADRGDGGFGYALVTGVVAAMAMNASYYITWDLDIAAGGWLPARVSAAVAGALLGFALTPSLIRRACRAGVQAAWWRPAAGAAAGILLGSAVAPATVPGATALALIPGLATRHAVIASLLTACAAAGITALAAGLATIAANRPRPWWPWPVSAAALAVACCTAAALWPIPGLAVGGPAERGWLMFLLPADGWRWLALSYPAVALLLVIRTRPKIPAFATAGETPSYLQAARAPGIPRPALRRGAAAALAAVCAASAATVLFLPSSFPPAGAPAAAVVRATEERWWTITLAGWVVLVTVTLAAGVAGLARACVSAWLTCVLAAAEITAYGVLTGHPGGSGAFTSSLITPSVWLFYLAVPTSCLALPRSGIATAAARAWTLPAAATAGAAAAAVLVVVTGIPGLLVALPPVPPPQPPPGHRQLIPPAPPHLPAPGPGQELTKAAALRVISAVAATLPAGWIDEPPTPPGSAGQVTIIPAACQPLADADYMNVRPAAAINITSGYRTAPQAMPTGSERFSIEVESFSSLVPPVLLAAARQERGACRQFTATGSGGPVTFTVNPPGGRAPGGPMWRVDFTIVSSGGIQAASTRIVADIGHNLILVTAQTDVRGYQPPPDQPLIRSALNAAIDALPRT